MAGIMDFFRAPPDQKQQTQQTQQTQTQADPNLSANPDTTQKDGKMPGTGVTAENPLDVYAKMFENASKNSEAQAPEFKLDPKVLDEVSSKMDFAKTVDPALLQKAQTGDASAMMQLMQSVSQNAYKAALEHSSALTGTYLNQRQTFDNDRVNAGVRQQLTHQALAGTPNYDHPVIKQELNAKAAQFAKANPDMPPQEIAKAAQKYINDLYSAMNPVDTTKNTDGSVKEKEMDWTKYLGS